MNAPRRTRSRARLISIAVVVTLVVVLLVSNLEHTSVDLVIGHVTLPRAVLLGGVFLLGVLFGAALKRRR